MRDNYILGGIIMWKDLSKLEKAGLVIGGIECVAGFGIAMYAHIKLKKQNEEIQDLNNILETNLEYINDLTMNKED